MKNIEEDKLIKKYKKEFGFNYRNRTIESLKAEIKYRTYKVNENIKSTPKEILNNTFVNQAINELKELSGSKTNKLRADINRARSRESLIRQVRELKSYENWDIYSEEGKKELSARAEKAYEKFKNNILVKNTPALKDMTKEEWKSMSEALGALKSGTSDRNKKQEISTLYDDLIGDNRHSSDFIEAWSKASEKGKIKFVDIWKELEEEIKGEGYDSFKIIEMFKERVSNYI